MDSEKRMKNRAKILISIAMLQLVAVMALATPVRAAHNTSANVLPATVEIPTVGDTVTVNVYVNETEFLFAYEIKVWFLNSILDIGNASSVVRPAGHFLEPIVDPANQFVPKWIANQTFNATHGLVWASYTLLAPEVGRNGTGILFSMTFTGIALGTSPIILNNEPGTNGPVKFADSLTGSAMLHTATDGSITVIPEFPIALLLPILAISTFAAASFARLYRKRRL